MLPIYKLADAIRGRCLREAVCALNEKADPNGSDLDGSSMLSLCEKWKANDIARLLIREGANVLEVKGPSMDSLLHQAVKHENLEFAMLMIEAGVSPNVQNAKGQTPLHITAQSGHEYLTKLLLKRGADPMVRDSQGYSAFDIALRSNQPTILKTFGQYMDLGEGLRQSGCQHPHTLFNAMRPHLSSWDQETATRPQSSMAEKVREREHKAANTRSR